MKTLITLAMVLMISSISFANDSDFNWDNGSDDDYSWGYCSNDCNKIVSTYSNGHGICTVVLECPEMKWNSETEDCEETGKIKRKFQNFVCPRPAPMPPLPY